MDADRIRLDYIAHSLDDIKRDRRALHRIPEIGSHEFKTQSYLAARLKELAPDKLESIADTGLKCVFYGRAPLPEGVKRRAIGFRADMDALNVNEETGLEFASAHRGFMHACGHDGHMATMLAVARFLSENRTHMRDDAVIFFQPDEELHGGAERIIAQGGMSEPKIDEIYGMHVMPLLPSGKIACPDGPLMASACEMDICIDGAAVHGALPHLGHDALAAAVALYGLLQTVFTRQTDPSAQKVFTVGAMEAGERHNVVAAHAVMHTTLRTYDEKVEARCLELMRAHMRAIEIAYGVKCRIEILSRYLPVINDPHAAQRVRNAAGGMCTGINPLTIAEDFSFYQRQAAGAFFFCGLAQAGMYDRPLHSSDFNFDESSLLSGLKVFIGLIDLI